MLRSDYFRIERSLEANPAFDALAHRFETPGTGHASLSGRINGQRVTAELLRDADRDPRAHGVSLTVHFEGKPRLHDDGPSLLLRGEDATDVRDKERGLVREVQTGFPAFDRRVFIDNTCSEDEARRLLAKESTRTAARRLLDIDGSSIFITPTSATFSMPLQQSTQADLLEEVLDEMLTVARVGGPRDTARSKHRGTALPVISAVTMALTFGHALWAYSQWPVSFAVAGIAVVVALAVALFSRPAIEDACAGDSSSGSRVHASVFGFALTALAGTFGLIVHLNGALDASKGSMWHGVVADVSEGRTRRRFKTMRVQWRDGTQDARPWEPLKRGDRYTERRFDGALGFEWVDRSAEETPTRRFELPAQPLNFE